MIDPHIALMPHRYRCHNSSSFSSSNFCFLCSFLRVHLLVLFSGLAFTGPYSLTLFPLQCTMPCRGIRINLHSFARLTPPLWEEKYKFPAGRNYHSSVSVFVYVPEPGGREQKRLTHPGGRANRTYYCIGKLYSREISHTTPDLFLFLFRCFFYSILFKTFRMWSDREGSARRPGPNSNILSALAPSV